MTRSFRQALALGALVLAAASCVTPPPATSDRGGTGGAGTGGVSAGVGTGGMAGNGGSGGTAGLAGTGSGGAGTGGSAMGGIGGRGGGGGAPVTVTDPTMRAMAVAALRADIASDRPADAAGFQTRWPTKYLSGLPYDPLQAQGIDKLTASRLGVSDAERQALARNGFVISGRQMFPTFFYGYKSIYADHLPLFVSVDSIMHAVHRSYDSSLQTIELSFLIPTLKTLLSDMHADLAGAGADLSADVRADADLFLTVARQLLGDTAAAPVAGASASTISQLVTMAQQAAGVTPVSLFGEIRYIDFTMFKPRGHYNNDPRLQTYFRSMIWLGRTDLRFLQYDTSAAPDAPPRFFRRQFLAALLLANLTDAGDRLNRWRQMDDVLRAYVGESDNMTIADFPGLRQVAGATTSAALANLTDAEISQALLDGSFGIQRIASQILFVPPDGAGVPLDRVFLFFGQRFVIDSQVFSDVVFDRVRGDPKRMMPNPLDVAFAALGNNAAAPLLATELGKYPNYPGALHDMRRLVDLHGDDFWGGSLYTTWLGALRGLSIANGDPTSAAGLPAVMKTEPWARRVLNTQLASWAELRHDTLLYAKQSFTAIPSCDFPDAYVDPYPEAWAGIVRLARLGQAVAAALPPNTVSSLGAYFAQVESVAATLGGMAAAERNGQPLTSDQLAFINQAVDETPMAAGCAQIQVPKGWYVKLFLTPSDSQKMDPTIADVHSDPADSAILHVATGLPRLMYVTVDGCNGPRAYAGVVSAYFEKTTTNYTRLTDQEWSTMIMPTTPADVSWVSSLVAR